jgi:ATP-dependent helicase/nuclease subunit B
VSRWPDLDRVAALERAVRQVRDGDPLRPVAVLVPNPLQGRWLERRIFADTGHIGIDFLLPRELAWRVAMPGLLSAGRARIPENVDLAILLSAIPGAVAEPTTPAYLVEAAATSGFGPAALRTIRDLEAAGLEAGALDAAAASAADPDRLRLLARLYRGYREAVARARLVTDADLYRIASAALPARDLGAVVACGLQDVPPVEAAFLDALRAYHRFAVVDDVAVAPRTAGRAGAQLQLFGVAPSPAAAPPATAAAPATAPPATALQRIQAGLFAPAVPGEPDATVHVLSAAGEALEAVEIARLIQQAADEGVRYEEVAVLLRNPDAYGVALSAAFDRAGVEAYFVEGIPRIDPAARALSLLLDLVGADLDRARVMEFLTSARVRWTAILGEGADVSPSRFDRLSARAGIVSGLEAWRVRIARSRQAREERQYEDDRDLRLFDSLLRLVERLAADLATIPERGTWSQFLEPTLALLDDWIERPELTRQRLERLLGPLALYAPPPTREQFLTRVREVLATQVYREGALGEGRVFVGSIAAARGLRFRRVFVPGLVERAFPAPVRPDPLLLDDERAALSPALRTTRDLQEAERVLFLDAVRAAEERIVFSYPRFDTSSGRERVPSSFLLRALEAAHGRRFSTMDLARLADPGATALGRPHPVDAGAAIDRIERDLALAAGGVPGAARHLAVPGGWLVRSLAQEHASWEPVLTPWDGIVTAGPEELARLRLAGQVSSATAVQSLAGCPYRHLLERGLGLREWEEPERAYQIEGKHFGGMYHEVAHRLFAELAEQGGLPLREEALPALGERIGVLVDESLAAFEAEGGIVNAALLEPVRVRLCSDLEEMLRDQLETAGDFVPAAFEHAFADLAVPLGDGTSIAFRGSIDRIDVAAGSRQVRVVDYKTGGYYWERTDQFRGGRELQLAIYNQAARAAYPDHEVADASYYYSTAVGRYRRKACAATPEVDETLRRVLVDLDSLAASGVFPPVADDCRFCSFTAVCGPFREDRALRKADDPRLVAFRRLREIP